MRARYLLGAEEAVVAYYYLLLATHHCLLLTCSALWKLMEVFILLPGVSGRAGTAGCSASSYTMLGAGGAAPPAAGGVDIGVKGSGAG